jgi:hypothetical protein
MARERKYKEFAEFGREGGKTRAQNMTPEQRSEAARKAVQARWAGHVAKRPAANRKKKSS